MSEKNIDKKGRWRSKTIAFRVSPEENEELERMVALSGLTKQDYIISKLEDKKLILIANSRVYKNLISELLEIKNMLQRVIDESEVVQESLIERLEVVTDVLWKMEQKTR
ncbi:plasmid mobilization protein [Pseudobutyrivibrio sp.]|uniref:plasmid mobilization protein n=1 Tax=Pseudobutyrivibrio sp. TaxID=2014367 RepID=UPI003869D42E